MAVQSEKPGISGLPAVDYNVLRERVVLDQKAQLQVVGEFFNKVGIPAVNWTARRVGRTGRHNNMHSFDVLAYPTSNLDAAIRFYGAAKSEVPVGYSLRPMVAGKVLRVPGLIADKARQRMPHG